MSIMVSPVRLRTGLLRAGSCVLAAVSLLLGLPGADWHFLWHAGGSLAVLWLSCSSQLWMGRRALAPTLIGACLITAGMVFAPYSEHTSRVLLGLLMANAASLLPWPELIASSFAIYLLFMAGAARGMMGGGLFNPEVALAHGIYLLTMPALVKSWVDGGTRLHSLNRDLERKTAELERTLKICPGMIGSIRLSDGVILSSNARVRDTLGYEPEEIVGKTAFAFVAPGDLESVVSTFQTIRDGEGILDVQTRLLKKDGTLCWVEWSAVPVPDEGLLYWAVQDISKRKETLLLQQTAAIQAAMDSITLLDEHGRFSFVNAAELKMYGLERADQLLGRHWTELYPETESLRVGEILPEMRRQGHWRGDLISRRPDGSTFPVELTLSFIPGGGAVGIKRDVSERKALEEQSHHLARLQSDLVSTVSHELRTPLTAIHAALGILTVKLAGQCDEKAANLLAIAMRNSDRLVRLVNDLLDLQRLQSGRLPLKQSICRADMLVEQSVAGMRALLDQAFIQVAVKAGPVPVSADPDRVVQVLTNLLSNAVKFSEPASPIEVQVSRAGSEVVFAIRDHGHGIPREYLSRIFEPFVQVDASDSRQKRGSGLGLTIARTLVDEMGGRLWVESEVGQGSCFSFTLRAAVPPASVAEPS